VKEANDDSDMDLPVEFSKRKSVLALVSVERKMSAPRDPAAQFEMDCVQCNQ